MDVQWLFPQKTAVEYICCILHSPRKVEFKVPVSFDSIRYANFKLPGHFKIEIHIKYDFMDNGIKFPKEAAL